MLALTQEARAMVSVLVVDTSSVTDVGAEQQLDVPGPSGPVTIELPTSDSRTPAEFREAIAEAAAYAVDVGSTVVAIGEPTSHTQRAGIRYLDVPVSASLPLAENRTALLAGAMGIVTSRLIL